MKEGGERTLLIVALVAVGGVLLWLFAKGKKAQAATGSSGGVFSTVSTGLNGVLGIGQTSINAAVKAGETVTSGTSTVIKDIADTTEHVVSDMDPRNW